MTRRRVEVFRMAATMFAALVAAASASAALFTDSFDTAASSANYVQVQSDVDVSVTYGFDYSALGIPAAPGGSGTTGLRLAANIVNPAARAAVTLHTLQQFSGSYAVSFDAWVNSNGPFPAGGAGSTEYVMAGVGGDGTTVNNTNTSLTTPAHTGSGAWFMASGEGGGARDYLAFKAGIDQILTDAVLGPQWQADSQNNNATTFYSDLGFGSVDVATLPIQGANNSGPAGQSGVTAAGSLGFAWHKIKIEVDPTGGTEGAALVRWLIDGTSIVSLDGGVGGPLTAAGSVTVGHLDPFSSVSGGPDYNFSLIDNLLVEEMSGGAIDADFDGVNGVDGGDVLIWQQNYEITAGSATNAQGDADGDGNVTAADLGFWVGAFPSSTATLGVVPEPTGWASSIIAAVAAVRRGRRIARPN